MGNRNRTAGIRAELKIANELMDLGFDLVVSTRSESKNLDDKGVDLMQLKNCQVLLPCFLQVKKTINTPNVHEILASELDKPLVIVHTKEEKRKTRFYEVGDYVYMKKEFFYKLLQDAYINLPENTLDTCGPEKVL